MLMAHAKQTRDVAAELAVRLTEALSRERIIPRFVDSYVVEEGRYGLQVHAALYRDLLGLLHREALLTMAVHALEVTNREASTKTKSQSRRLPRKEGMAFRQKLLSALTRYNKWNAGDALDFQRDLHIYEGLIARSGSGRRRKPFEAANHPFVDRCAFLLDSSFLEKARLAASRTLPQLEKLTEDVAAIVLKGSSPPRSQTSH